MTIDKSDIKVLRPGLGPVAVKQVFAQGGQVPFHNRRYAHGGLIRRAIAEGHLVSALAPHLPREAGERHISKEEAQEIMGPPEQLVTDTIVTEAERLVGLEIRAELLKVIQEVGPRVMARLRACDTCGKLFLTKKNGHRAKRCLSCR